MQTQPKCRLSDTTKKFATAGMDGRPRSTRRSMVDRTYSVVTAAFASRTISTVSPSELACSSPAVVSTAEGTPAFP
jgi:hypothetical protein